MHQRPYRIALLAGAAFVWGTPARPESPGAGRAADGDSLIRGRGDSITVRIVDTDIRAAIQAMARWLDRPVAFGALPSVRVTIESARPLPRTQLLPLLRSTLEANNLELQSDSAAGLYRVRTRELQRAAGPSAAERPPQGIVSGGIELFVIHLKHARAADVAAGVNALYGRASAFGELGAEPRSIGNDGGIRPLATPNRGAPPGVAPASLPPVAASSAGPPMSAGGSLARGASLSAELTIVPDPRSNALFVRATRQDFALVEAAVRELDVRPLQVLVEVLIAEVRRDRNLIYGMDVAVAQTELPGRSGGTLGGTVSGASASDLIVRLLTFQTGTVDINATLRAAASRGEVRIHSQPVLIAANNELAEILVGSQRPFIQVQRSLPTDAPIRDQVVQYKDVGTRLSVRPTISADGYVMLAVTQEINAATTETAFDAPVISTRSVQTQLLIRDKQTIALGGLTDRQQDQSQSGVPVLSSIPWVGGLFGRTTRRTSDTELYVFLTPRIIRDDADADAVTSPLRSRIPPEDR
ncbi:MAG: hypothetical protein K2R93_19680 [Gemmatimonadaceae bacterium]|nr:hypothetical protein [Gemmatimonadaceae bacterium]